MRRLISISLVLFIGLLSIMVTAAQEPAATEDPFAAQATVVPAQPTVDPALPTVDPALQPTADPFLPPAPTQMPAVAPETPILTSARTDMELLATTVMGSSRPTGWSGSLDFTNPQLPLLIRLDLELLAGQTMGAETRPADWFGAVPSTSYAIARDIRHDLELVADQALGLSVRPPGWIGDDPVMRCNRGTQTLVSLLERAGVFVLAVDPTAPNYCQQVELQATQFAEINLLSNPDATGKNALSIAQPPAAHTVNTDFAVAFLDRSAQLSVGVVPNGTGITPVARSYAQFSKMMLVRGENFEVFVDYQFTSVTAEEFDVLPDVSSITANPTCGADWCIAG